MGKSGGLCVGGKGRVKREGRGLRLVKGGNSGRVKDGKRGRIIVGKWEGYVGKKGRVMGGKRRMVWWGEGYRWEKADVMVG